MKNIKKQLCITFILLSLLSSACSEASGPEAAASPALAPGAAASLPETPAPAAPSTLASATPAPEASLEPQQSSEPALEPQWSSEPALEPQQSPAPTLEPQRSPAPTLEPQRSPAPAPGDSVIAHAPSSSLPSSAVSFSPISFSIEDIAPYSGQPYITVNDNVPFFSEEDFTSQSFAVYSELDELGRCGTACASIGVDIMPTKERDSIGYIKPSGWHTVKYNDIIDGNYLYNRCHLIGYQLCGGNDEKNLFTGTRHLNVQGMQPFENMVANYVRETEDHVLYRVTPIFEGDNLLASGVLMEGESRREEKADKPEDMDRKIQFCVYVYNVQPGITINYSTGESSLAPDTGTSESVSTAVTLPASTPGSTVGTISQPVLESTPLPDAAATALPTALPDTAPTPLPTALSAAPTPRPTDSPAPILPATAPAETPQAPHEEDPPGTDYILNTNTMKFHYPTCRSVKQMKDKNKQEYTGTRDEVISHGYSPCQICKP